MSDWTGHPWATADHRPLTPTKASCAGCSEYCHPHCGCSCCNEPAYEWLLAEARWWADYQRRLLSDAQWAMHGDEFPDTFPWEAQP